MGCCMGKWDGEICVVYIALVCYTAGDYGNDGCNGGNMKASFRYMVSNRGINGASHYPYKARVSGCRHQQ